MEENASLPYRGNVEEGAKHVIAPMTVPIGRVTAVANLPQQAGLRQMQTCYDGTMPNALGRRV
jgi:hypothetical protein